MPLEGTQVTHVNRRRGPASRLGAWADGVPGALTRAAVRGDARGRPRRRGAGYADTPARRERGPPAVWTGPGPGLGSVANGPTTVTRFRPAGQPSRHRRHPPAAVAESWRAHRRRCAALPRWPPARAPARLGGCRG